MPSRIQCFWLEDTDQVYVFYRRHGWSSAGKKSCGATRPGYPGGEPHVWDYHDASVIIEHARPRTSNDAGHPPSPMEMADLRWPKRCACGYEFQQEDAWQVSVTSLFKRADTGELVSLTGPKAAPVGAMWNAKWMVGSGHNPKPLSDGRFLVVRTPAGDWSIDGPSSNNNGQGWTRKGIPPYLVVTPSIGLGEPQRMHGWLGGSDGRSPGVLVIDRP